MGLLALLPTVCVSAVTESGCRPSAGELPGKQPNQAGH